MSNHQQHYGLTYVKNTDPNFIHSYYDILGEHQLLFPGVEFDMMFEYKPVTKRLHAHLYLKASRKKRLSQYPFQKKGWSNRLDYLETEQDKSRWHQYYKKNKANQTDLINQEFQYQADYKSAMDRASDTEDEVRSSMSHNDTLNDRELPDKYKYPAFDIRKIKSAPILSHLSM